MSQLYLSVVYVFLALQWSGFIRQSVVVACGGIVSAFVNILLALLVLVLKYPDGRRCCAREIRNVNISLAVFLALYLFFFSLPGAAQTSICIPILGVDLPKQVFNFTLVSLNLFAFSKILLVCPQERLYSFGTFIFCLLLVQGIVSGFLCMKQPELIKKEADNNLFLLGYSGAYVYALVFPLVLLSVTNANDVRTKRRMLGALLVIMFAVYYAGFFIAEVILLLSVFLFFLSKVRNMVARVWIVSLTTVLVLFFGFSEHFQNALLWLADIVNIDFISQRLREIVDFLRNGIETADERGQNTTYRFVIYSDTFNSFVKNPFLGGALFKSSSFYSVDHCTILDLLSVGGLALCVPFFVFLFRCYQFAVKFLTTEENVSLEIMENNLVGNVSDFKEVENRRRIQVIRLLFVSYLFFACVDPALDYRMLGVLFFFSVIFLTRPTERPTEKETDHKRITLNKFLKRGIRRFSHSKRLKILLNKRKYSSRLKFSSVMSPNRRRFNGRKSFGGGKNQR